MSGQFNTLSGATLFQSNSITGGANDVEVNNLTVDGDITLLGNSNFSLSTVGSITVNGELNVTGDVYANSDLYVGGNIYTSGNTLVSITPTINYDVLVEGASVILAQVTIPTLGSPSDVYQLSFNNVSFDLIRPANVYTQGLTYTDNTSDTNVKYGICKLPWNGKIDSRFTLLPDIKYTWSTSWNGSAWVINNTSQKVNISSTSLTQVFTTGTAYGLIAVNSISPVTNLPNEYAFFNAYNIQGTSDSISGPTELAALNNSLSTSAICNIRMSSTTGQRYKVGDVIQVPNVTFSLPPGVYTTTRTLFLKINSITTSGGYVFYQSTYDSTEGIFAFSPNFSATTFAPINMWSVTNGMLYGNVDNLCTVTLTDTIYVAATKVVAVGQNFTTVGSVTQSANTIAVNNVQTLSGAATFSTLSVAQLDAGFTPDRRQAVVAADAPTALNPFLTVSGLGTQCANQDVKPKAVILTPSGGGGITFADGTTQSTAAAGGGGGVPGGSVTGAMQYRSSIGTFAADDAFTYDQPTKRQRITNASSTVDVAPTLISLTSAATGGSLNPCLNLTNTNATGSVAMEIYKNKPTAGIAGDVLYNQSVYGKDSGNVKQEFTRVTHTIRDSTAGTEDGSIEFSAFTNGAINTFLQINGVENEVNCLKALDMMTGASIRSSGADVNITGVGSSSTGNINLTAKAITGSINALSTVKTDNTITNYTGSGGSVIDFAGGTPDDRFAVSKNFIRQHWNNLTDQADIYLENDYASANSVIGLNYQSPSGNLGTYIQNIPSIQRIQQVNGISNSNAEYSPQKVTLSGGGGSDVCTFENTVNAFENRMSMFKNQGSGIYETSGIVNGTSNQQLFLTYTDNSIGRAVNITNNSSSSAFVSYDNTMDASPLYIQSTYTSLVFNAPGTNPGSGDLVFQPSSSVGDLVFNGTNIESSSSSGSSGQHLRIKLNGVYYKIGLDND